VEAKNTVDRLLAGLVPVMTLVMTGMVGFIMMAILLPIMSISGAIQ
jgi:general secretion pathway protein F